VGEPLPVIPRLVVINKADADPPLVTPYLLDRSSELTREFSIASAVTQIGGGPALRYYWYYDYSPKVPFHFAQVCGTAPRCVLSVCQKAKATDKDHFLRVVASNGDLAETPKNPFDFASGTAFDSVEWRLELVGNCPALTP